MAGMFDYEDPEYVPGAGQGLSPLSLEAATKYAQDLARFGKGAVTGTFGALGDVESFGRGVRSAVNPQGSTVLNAFLSGMNQPTVLPTSSDVNKAINPYMPSFMAGEATAPQQIGEFVSLGGLLSQAAKRVPSLVRATENAPVGLSIKPVQGAPKSGLGFYSAVEDAALNLQRNSGAGQAFLNDIKKGANVKDEEIKWIGLDEFLAGKKNVTKQEVQDYIANNKVDVQEVQLGNLNRGELLRLKELDEKLNSGKTMTPDEQVEYNRLVDRESLLHTSGLAPRFGQYTLPGGENYREILLTMPQKKIEFSTQGWYAKPKGNYAWLVFDERGNQIGTAYDAKNVQDAVQEVAKMQGATPIDKNFRSGHWEQPNVLAHLRVNDRMDADGKKMLLIEEVQSDWHQAGRDKGYNKLPDDAQVVQSPYTGDFIVQRANGNYLGESATTREEAIQSAIRHHGGVPDAPMKDTWYQLALKRALQYAAENGYDRVGLTTGARQAERYDLSKQIKSIAYIDNKDGTYDITALTPNNRLAFDDKRIDSKKLPELFGKEIADKILSDAGKEFPKNTFSEGMKELTGLDLQVGGEGMKKYYDEVYPKFLQKYGKKWDAKMGNTTIEADGAEPVRYIDVTPKMKQSVTETGQPLFSVAAPIGTGALVYEEINRTGLENPLLK